MGPLRAEMVNKVHEIQKQNKNNKRNWTYQQENVKKKKNISRV